MDWRKEWWVLLAALCSPVLELRRSFVPWPWRPLSALHTWEVYLNLSLSLMAVAAEDLIP